MNKIYYIWYHNGERYDDHWSGVLESAGFFSSPEKAQDKIKELQITHDHRIREEIEQGITFPSFENEKWEVKSGHLY